MFWNQASLGQQFLHNPNEFCNQLRKPMGLWGKDEGWLAAFGAAARGDLVAQRLIFDRHSSDSTEVQQMADVLVINLLLAETSGEGKHPCPSAGHGLDNL